MADIALTDTLSNSERAAVVRRSGGRDRRFRMLTGSAALLVVVIFAGVITSLGIGSYPAFHTFGFAFFYTEVWNPVTEKFGALASLRRPIGIAIELLAGIPSIIYGIWGLFIFAPWFQAHVQPDIIAMTADIPFLQVVLAGPPYGIGIFTSALILSIMVLPFISAVTRDVFETVPPMQKEAAYGLGCTTWEVMWRVVLPFARSGVVGGAMLALGRALGETMAVTFVIGNAHRINPSIFAPGTTISATIANEFTEAVGDLYLSSLIAMGLILFLITFVVLASAQLMLRALERRAGSAS